MTIQKIQLPALLSLLLLAGTLTAQTIPGTTLPDSLPVLDSLPRAAVQAYADEVNTLAATLKTHYADLTRQALEARREADKTLRTVRADTTIARDSVRQLEQVVRARRDVEKEAAKIEKLAGQLATQAARVAKLDSLQQRRQLPRVFYPVRTLAYRAGPLTTPTIASVIGAPGVSEPGQPPAEGEAPADKPAGTDDSATKVAATATMLTRPPKGYRTYDPAADVLLNPPTPPCSLAVNLRDEFSGEWRRELTAEELFRAARSGRDATLAQPGVIADAHLGSAGSAVALYLTVRVYDAPAGSAAGRRLGGMPRGGLAMIKFLDGSTTALTNLRGDDGTPDPNGGGFTLYRAQYALDATALKKIRKVGVDKLRLAWNAGYEDYDVQNVELLMRQTRCLLD